MLLGDVTYKNVANLINDCSPDDVNAIIHKLYEDISIPEKIDLMIGTDKESNKVVINVDEIGDIFLTETIKTQAGNWVECHYHLEDLTIEELIAECLNWCKRREQSNLLS